LLEGRNVIIDALVHGSPKQMPEGLSCRSSPQQLLY